MAPMLLFLLLLMLEAAGACRAAGGGERTIAGGGGEDWQGPAEYVRGETPDFALPWVLMAPHIPELLSASKDVRLDRLQAGHLSAPASCQPMKGQGSSHARL